MYAAHCVLEEHWIVQTADFLCTFQCTFVIVFAVQQKWAVGVESYEIFHAEFPPVQSRDV